MNISFTLFKIKACHLYSISIYNKYEDWVQSLSVSEIIEQFGLEVRTFCFKWETKQTIGKDTIQTNTKLFFTAYPNLSHHIQDISYLEKKTNPNTSIIQTVYQEFLGNRNMGRFFDPHLLNRSLKKPRHVSSFKQLISPWICKTFCRRQPPPYSFYLTHLSHFRNLDSATQVYYKDFLPFFTCIFNTGIIEK